MWNFQIPQNSFRIFYNKDILRNLCVFWKYEAETRKRKFVPKLANALNVGRQIFSAVHSFGISSNTQSHEQRVPLNLFTCTCGNLYFDFRN